MEQYFIEQDSEVIENIAATYGVCYYFTNIDWHTKINGTIVFSEEMSDGALWVLWELKRCR